jgi:hypothetical protein
MDALRVASRCTRVGRGNRRTAAHQSGCQGHLRRRGLDLDPRRLDERLAAEREHAKRQFSEYQDQVEMLALAAKKTRRAAELDEAAWRRNSTQDNLARAKAAQSARKAADGALREFLLYDQDLISAVQLKYGR